MNTTRTATDDTGGVEGGDATSDATIETLRALISRDHALPPGALSPEATLESLGIDSLGLMELVFDLEDAFGIKVGSERPELSTVGDVVAWVEATVARQRGTGGAADPGAAGAA